MKAIHRVTCSLKKRTESSQLPGHGVIWLPPSPSLPGHRHTDFAFLEHSSIPFCQGLCGRRIAAVGMSARRSHPLQVVTAL